MAERIFRTLKRFGPFGILLLLAGNAVAGSGDPLDQGEQAFRRGDFGHAAAIWETQVQEQQPPSPKLSLRLAAALRELGDTGRAQGYLEAALRQVAGGPEEAALRSELGAVYVRRGEHALAADELGKALQLARDRQQGAVVARTLLRQAELQEVQDTPEQALTGFREAAVAAHAAAEPLLEAGALVGSARLLSGDDAVQALERAEALLRDSPDSHEHDFLLLSIGLGYQALAETGPGGGAGHLLAALRNFTAAAAQAERIGDQRILSYANGYLASLYELDGRSEEALAFNRRARFAAQQLDAREIRFRWEWQAGRLLRQLNRQQEAVPAYRRAVEDLQAVRHPLMASLGPDGNFRDTLGRLYFELADLLLQLAGETDDPHQEQAYLFEVRDTLERFKTAELEDYFRDDCVAAFEAQTTTLEQLGERIAVIYPVLLPNRTELLVHIGGTMHRLVVPVDRATLDAAVVRYRQLLEKRTTRQYLIPARQLYDWLLRPLEPLLQAAQVQTLVFVPDGPLRTIPLAALNDGKAYVVERYAVAVTPGLELTGLESLGGGDMQVLVNGLTESVQGFPGLPHVADEIDGIAERFGGTRLQDQAFVLDAVGRELDGTSYSVVHFASHGKFEGDFRDTFLLTFDGRLTLDELERHLRSGRYRDRPVELLTLSACQTAAGDDRAALGLAGVAVKSGARSALASLWFINDQASSQLVVLFYDALKEPGVSKAEALRRAQLALMQDLRYRHAGYWAPFLLIGNWL